MFPPHKLGLGVGVAAALTTKLPDELHVKAATRAMAARRKIKITDKTLNNLIQGRFTPREGTIFHVYNKLWPGLWPEDAHAFCGTLITHQVKEDSWWGRGGARGDNEATLQCARYAMPKCGESFTSHHWRATKMVWGITTISSIVEPDAKDCAAVKLRAQDKELLTASSSLMFRAIEEVMDDEGDSPFQPARVYFKARFAVDASFDKWHLTPRGERGDLEEIGRSVFGALSALVRVQPSNVGAIMTSTAIASRFRWRKEYQELLRSYQEAIGAEGPPIERTMAELDGTDTVELNSDFRDFVDRMV